MPFLWFIVAFLCEIVGTKFRYLRSAIEPLAVPFLWFILAFLCEIVDIMYSSLMKCYVIKTTDSSCAPVIYKNVRLCKPDLNRSLCLIRNLNRNLAGACV